MNNNILQPEVQEFINENLKSDTTKLILKGSPFPEISIQELVNQILAKKKSIKKLSTWFNTAHIYYPNKLSIEQTSSEITAKYKTTIISGSSIIDITGGFGVDCHAFSTCFKQVTHCEINTELSEIVTHNYKQLKVNNITTIPHNGLDYLKNTTETFDCIYIDPSRRNDLKGKVFLLKDCLPNVPESLEFLFEKTATILIKNSPILDISSTLKELKYVKEIHVVAFENEVKELLFLLEKEYDSQIELKTINFSKKGTQLFAYTYQSEEFATYSLPKTYLYEPNAAILKSGGFHHVATFYKVHKLHQHSHLYTSNGLIDFPGRKFTIEQVLNYDKKQLLKVLPEKKANITTRNFPKTVAQIRKETKIKDGGNIYLFFTKNIENKNIVLVCKALL